VVPTDLDDPYRSVTARELTKALAQYCAGNACKSATNDFVGDVVTVANKLGGTPVRVPVKRANGSTKNVRVSGVELVSDLVEADLNPGLAATLPSVVRAARNGNLKPLGRITDLVLAAQSTDAIDLSFGLFAATICNDGPLPWATAATVAERPATLQAAVAALPSGTFGQFGSWAYQVGNASFCLGWPEPSGQAALAAGPLPNVPVLAVAGGIDMRTPAASAAAVAEALAMFEHPPHRIEPIGEFAGDGEQELVTDAPPGPGWEWYGGENDGKIHGPLRVGEIGLGAATNTGPCTLELREVIVDTSCPEEKRCVLLAESRDTGNDASFVVRARALSDTPLNGELNWKLRDWEGNEVGKGKQTLAVPAKSEPVEFKLQIREVDRAHRKFLEAEISLEIPGQEVAPVLAAWVATSKEKGDATLEPESPFGMGLYLNRYGGDAGGLALMERAAQMARDAGVKWSREDFSWGRIERQRGQFDWTYYDNLVACARRNGITVYAIVGYWTRWTKPYTSEGIDDYAKFLKVMVQRYQKEIKQWEIWNEPNIFFWDGPKDLYAELLIKSYAAIKEIDPGAQVLGLSTAGIDRKFISRMLELKTPFDILTIHPYRSQLNDLAFIDDLKKVSDQVKLPDGQRRPVWLTEMGWATHTPHNTLRQDFAANTLRAQAELIARSYLCAIVSGVEPRTFWYDFRNDGDDPIYFEHQMGIVYNDFRPKPAYVAYATLTHLLRGKRLFGPIPAPQGVLAFNFRPAAGSSGETIALWSPQADTRVELPSTAQQITRINGIGEESKLKVQFGKLIVDLKKGTPIYLLIPTPAAPKPSSRNS
jgi:hypothetical protein